MACARFGLAMHCGFPIGPILDCEPKAFREASGIEQSSRRFRLFSSHASVIPVTIRAPALAQFPFERRLRAEGGPPQNCIIFDTSSKQDLDLLGARRRELRAGEQGAGSEKRGSFKLSVNCSELSGEWDAATRNRCPTCF